MALPLIDKQDNFEIIRDQIAGILALETIAQQALATAAAKDPDDWKLRVFAERSNPWDEFNNEDNDKSPLVNVWYDSSTFDLGKSNISERQHADGVFNIDIYGYGVASDDGATGHNPGDREAALEAHRALRLVRNILMASENTYLKLRGLVWQRWPRSTTSFQPQIDGRNVSQVLGVRIAFSVSFSEFSPQYQHETLDYVAIDVKRAENGAILVEADYDYT